MIDKISIQEIAFKIVQDMGITPLQVDNGVTLNYEYSKAIAVKCVKLLMKEEKMNGNRNIEPTRYWHSVYKEIKAMEL